ncbi:hypothetical protein KDA_11300 [Dictyobacter alpinus]|uniref:Lipoprotein LpqB beta-propeller domain-containing protein n=1 Tax=Dictyobacter alpinus TaxID=2014873 RepID=A0A402B2S1_9CHLR|nr:hypothetical protein [Dictyobacter alpinus]GCE25646.1 hypothetical protein KDA_11300 [Dictyobacter alpinus]
MVQSLISTEVATALTGYVTPQDQAQHVLVATEVGNIHEITLVGEQAQVEIQLLAHLDDAVINTLAGYVTDDGVQHAVMSTIDGNIYHISAGERQQIFHVDDGVMVVGLAAYAVSGTAGQHALVATSDDDIYYLSWQAGQEALSERVVHTEASATSIAGYYSSADAQHHLLIAASDGNLYEYTFKAQQPAQQRVLDFFDEKFFGMTAYLLPGDHSGHVVVATRDGKLYHVSYPAQSTPVQVDALARFYLVSKSDMMYFTSYAQADGLQHIIIGSSDGAIHHFSWRGSPQQLLKLTPDALERQQKDVNHEIMTTFGALY